MPASDQNGIITIYQVQYTQTAYTSIQSVKTVIIDAASTLMITLSDLQEYTEYVIQVRASTSAGTGPYSSGVTAVTNQSSKLPSLCATDTCAH